MNTYKILSIDAWGNPDEGYEWNQWFDVGTVELNIDSPANVILKTMSESGFIRNPELGDVEDDGYNLVIVNKETREPVFAIVYGNQE